MIKRKVAGPAAKVQRETVTVMYRREHRDAL
jgi:hypothetical protein